MAQDGPRRARDRWSAWAAAGPDDTAAARRVDRDASPVGRLPAAAAEQHVGGRSHGVRPDDGGAAPVLFEDPRRQVDPLETQVVVGGRSRGMDRRRIARCQGLNSSQAAAGRRRRLMTRLEGIRQGVRQGRKRSR
ncbi:hypothetical protein [Streptomyces sp. NPDC048489]|uniref:hypothetical protein n=1 Tax=Streptomyces sp. NPDC048489 TaxID=3154504 RepID=UPI00343E7CC4